MNTLKTWFKSLKTDSKKRIFVIVITAILITALLITGIILSVKKKSNPSVETVQKITEVPQETTEPETETTTEIKTTTEVITEIKTETTTKQQKTQNNKKPSASNPKPQQKPQNNAAPPINNSSTNKDEKMKLAMQQQGVSSEAAYWKKVEEHKNYKCPYCGSVSCPSIKRLPDALGNPKCHGYDSQHPCPNILAGKAKCPYCGKTLVDDDRWLTDPAHYCDGFCQNVFE